MNTKADLAEQVLLHLEREEVFLGELFQLVGNMRDALLAKTDSDVLNTDHFDSAVRPRFDEISEARSSLRNAISHALGVSPEKATVGNFADTCDASTSERINQLRAKVRSRATDLNGMLATNGSLAHRLWSLMESVLRQLRGDAPYSPSYGRNGLSKVA